MEKYLFLFIGLLCSLSSFSQFNDSVYYRLKYNSSGNYNKTEKGISEVFNNEIKFEIAKNIISSHSSINYLYGLQNNKLSNNDLSVASDFNLFENARKLYYWGLATFDKSYSLQIKIRTQAGFGLGYTVLKKENKNLVISEGLLYEYSSLYNLEPYNTIRNSFRIKYKLKVANRIDFEGSNYIQNSIFNLKDYALKTNNGLSFSISRYLAVNAAIIYNRININKKENLFINYGISFERYF